METLQAPPLKVSCCLQRLVLVGHDEQLLLIRLPSRGDQAA